MGIDLVLNELSLKPLAENKQLARERMLKFQRTISAAVKQRTNNLLRCPENIHRKYLADGYTIGDLLNDPDVDPVLRSYLRALFTLSPYWFGDSNLQQKVVSRLFLFNDQEDATGLGVTALLNGLAVSFSSNEIWNRTQFDVKIVTELQGDDGESLTTEETIPVRNISQPNHLADHQDWIKQRLTIMPETCQILWERRTEWFPNLEFCDDTTPQILAITPQMLSSVTEHLISLQRYCETWTDGNFDREQFPPSRIDPESSATLRKYGQERTFHCPDGQERIFSWHLRLTPMAWRIHFFPIAETKHIIVGYIGPHLRTVRYQH
jgi:hypothetical protein